MNLTKHLMITLATVALDWASSDLQRSVCWEIPSCLKRKSHQRFSQQDGGQGKLPLDNYVLCSWGGAGPRVPTQDVIKVDRFHRNINWSRKGTLNCETKKRTCDARYKDTPLWILFTDYRLWACWGEWYLRNLQVRNCNWVNLVYSPESRRNTK